MRVRFTLSLLTLPRAFLRHLPIYTVISIYWIQGFPGGASGKEPAWQYRRHKRFGFYPWVRMITWGRAWKPTPSILAWRNPRTEEPEGYIGLQEVGHDWSALARTYRKHCHYQTRAIWAKDTSHLGLKGLWHPAWEKHSCRWDGQVGTKDFYGHRIWPAWILAPICHSVTVCDFGQITFPSIGFLICKTEEIIKASINSCKN